MNHYRGDGGGAIAQISICRGCYDHETPRTAAPTTNIKLQIMLVVPTATMTWLVTMITQAHCDDDVDAACRADGEDDISQGNSVAGDGGSDSDDTYDVTKR